MLWQGMKDTFYDLAHIVGPILVVILIIIAPLVGLGVWGTYAACSRVCEANGDENGWDWWMGCFCRDEHGLYNPKDSREMRRENR